MSGFGALIDWTGEPPPAAVEHLVRGIAPRGPDGTSTHLVGAAALAHARFVTTPEAADERQPTRHATREWWLVADARIDNGDDLRAELSGASRRPLHTDADLILAAYERWGTQLAVHLVGDFAFAIWDGEAQRLLVARDHLGIRPVHWARGTDGRFVAASTLRAVLEASGLPRTPDDVFLVDHATFEHRHADLTPWSGVRRLRGGHVLVAGPEGERIERYWWPRSAYRGDDPVTAAAEVRRLFEQAVRCRLRAPAPVAVEISGGFDSSSVAAIAVQQVGVGPLFAMGLTFPGSDCDESTYIDAVSAHLGLDVHRFDALSVGPYDFAAEIAESLDVPTLPDSRWTVPFGRVAASHGCRVVLTGQGGDHLLYGSWRSMIGTMLVSGHALRAYRLLRGRGLTSGAALRRLPRLFVATSLRRRPHSWWARLLRRVQGMRGGRGTTADVSYLTTTARGLIDRRPPIAPELPGKWGFTRSVRAGHYDDTASWFIDLWDRAAVLSGLEGRHPFMDVRLVDYVLGLGEDVVAEGLRGRGLHRRMMGDALPDLVAQRTDKAEFSVPWNRAAAAWAAQVAVARERDPGSRHATSIVDHDAVRASSARIASDSTIDLNSWAWWGAVSVQSWSMVQ